MSSVELYFCFRPRRPQSATEASIEQRTRGNRRTNESFRERDEPVDVDLVVRQVADLECAVPLEHLGDVRDSRLPGARWLGRHVSTASHSAGSERKKETHSKIVAFEVQRDQPA